MMKHIESFEFRFRIDDRFCGKTKYEKSEKEKKPMRNQKGKGNIIRVKEGQGEKGTRYETIRDGKSEMYEELIFNELCQKA